VNNSSKKEIYLDGLRGLAVLLVSLGHIFYQFYIFKFGWIGLNLFFVLSGYLITSRLFYHLKNNYKHYFSFFYMRRVLRIFPLYYGCLVFFLIILPFFYRNYNRYFGSLENIQIWYWLYLSNWRLIFYGLPKNLLFFHFWSLAVEEQFYIFWPIIFKFTKSFRLRFLVIICLISFSISVRIFTLISDDAYYNTLIAAEPLLLGGLVCILQNQGKLSYYYNLLLILTFFSITGLSIIFFINKDLHISNRLLMQYGYSAIDMIWVFILYTTLFNLKLSRYFIKILSFSWLTWLGKYSYGIYVFHWLILQIFIYKFENVFSTYGLKFGYYLARVIGILAILFCSYLSYNLYEKYFLRLKKYFI
jgi:peptidoglycan/LPS O-acetylase OafA/YrhL